MSTWPDEHIRYTSFVGDAMSKCDEFVRLLKQNEYVDNADIQDAIDEYEDPESNLISIIKINGFWFHMGRWYEEVFVKNGF